MIANRNSISESEKFELIDDSDAGVPWVESEFSAEQAVVRGKRILLVDDEEPLRGLVRMMLELDGHQVTEASNGAEALSLFTIGEFDLVITDFEMPAMKGNDLAVRIKLLNPSLPILMITASEWARLDDENPVDALLNKPLTAPDLRYALGKLLSTQPDPARSSVVLV